MEKKKENVPLYKQIADDLKNQINTGVYKEGDIIPKEIDLAEIHYKVSRQTIRNAIETLVKEGYLERKKKKGTTVKKKKIVSEFTHFIESYDEDILRKGSQPKSVVLFFNTCLADKEVSEKLEINEGDEVYKLIRLRFIDNDPNVIVTTYLPITPLPDFLKIDFSKVRLYSYLEENGLPINYMVRKLEIQEADETTSHLLDIKVNDPIFYFHSMGYTGNRQPIEFSISKYRSDLNSFVFEIEDSNTLKLMHK